MNDKERALLKKDLCGRLPYNVKIEANVCPRALFPMDVVAENLPKPYLRHLSSMTDDEFQELRSICPHSIINKTNDPGWIVGISGSDYGRISRVDEISEFIDWLNEHHFDYRGLIGMGLAYEAPEGMYDTKI